MIAFVPKDKKLKEETTKVLKNFRKFNTKNTDRFFHFKYWLLEDEVLASQLKIDNKPGDVYLVRPSSPYNLGKPNAKLCNYDYTSEKILSHDQLKNDTMGSQTYA